MYWQNYKLGAHIRKASPIHNIYFRRRINNLDLQSQTQTVSLQSAE